MTERIQKIISAYGVTSRRNAEALIQEGRVTCNGQVCVLGQRADPDIDEILLDGKPLPSKSRNRYIMLNKPRGFVTTLSDEKGRKNVAQLVQNCGTRVYPVGRLDMDSEGLLLFTNDGDFSNYLMHPKHMIEKIYHTWVRGYSQNNFEKLKEPVVLDGYRIQSPKLRVINAQADRAMLEIKIHEGRNRQIRRMCEIAGMQVTRLRRVSEGSVYLGNLPLGKWRDLTEDEVAALKNEPFGSI